MTAPSPRAWLPHLRGALVALHILAISLLALPDVSGARNRSAWRSATVQDELAAWSARLNDVGVALGPDELEAKAWDIMQAWARLRTALLAPFQPYADLVGARQRWRMFAAPNRAPARLRIAVKIDGEWREVYEGQSEVHTWQAARFGTERIRVHIHRASWAHRRGDNERLVQWIADEAARDFPAATQVRVSWLRARSPTPAQVRDDARPEPKEERVRVLDLEARR
ncbi:hypothetical protein G6O69_16525 [Pseudenhygromyxa sp. WMMC2535]|uniref:hypothetical protein n=1 Tax=Pseudenhygromyxa sp. WMMC2535 TaxID=2712867 RepID=UPI001557134F|nr:hypothetical protein [Pseudenhygromyxa sp. WMMC2535]NVB39449.1 hypothetical protein [Pseudenhygromyxa sp. WMMC2535]